MDSIKFKRQKTDKIIADNFSTLCMSNAKWIKLLDALSNDEGLVKECIVKLVWDDNTRYMNIDGMQYDFDYYAESMEAMISGVPRGWCDYKEVEWCEFPKMAKQYKDSSNLKAGFREVEQNLNRIIEVSQSIGQLETESNKDAYRIYCYR